MQGDGGADVTAVNARFAGLRVSGMERYAREMSVRMGATGVRLVRPLWSLAGPWGQLWEQSVLPRRLFTHEVLWSPANTGPVTYHPQVVTVHDVAVFDHPEWFTGRVRVAYWTIVARLIREADFIATPSEFTRERVIARFAVDRKRVRVVRAGVSAEWLWPVSASGGDPVVRETLARLTSRRFGLAVGGNDPRKNTERLLTAWNYVRSVDADLELVVLGSANARVFRRQALTSQTWLHVIRNVSDAQLDQLYRRAEVVVYPSLYEGCGLPPLEACARGAPVVVSDIPALRETVGNAGWFVDPWDAKSIAAGVLEVVSQQAQHGCLRGVKGNLARCPTWEQGAEQMAELLAEAGRTHWR